VAAAAGRGYRGGSSGQRGGEEVTCHRRRAGRGRGPSRHKRSPRDAKRHSGRLHAGERRGHASLPQQRANHSGEHGGGQGQHAPGGVLWIL
jgi:hypothetical protein